MIGVGLSVGLANAPQSGVPASPNPNLLLWSEEMQQAVWTVSAGAVTVTADADTGPFGGSVADQLAFGASGTIGQTSSTAATTGAAVLATKTTAAAWARYSISGSFDGVDYVLSVYLRDPSSSDIRMRLERVGGFLRGSLQDIGDEPTLFACCWKLETPSLSAYVKREGT